MNVGGNRLLVARDYLPPYSSSNSSSLSLSASSLSINSHKSTVHLPFKIPKITPYPHLYQCLSIHRDPTLAAQAEG